MTYLYKCIVRHDRHMQLVKHMRPIAVGLCADRLPLKIPADDD